LRIQILVDNILPGLPEFDTQATAQTLPSGAEALIWPALGGATEVVP
jgi:hypothetical protein